MYYWMDSDICACTQICHIGTLSTQRLYPYTVVKVGGGMDPATEVIHFGLNLPLALSSACML